MRHALRLVAALAALAASPAVGMVAVAAAAAPGGDATTVYVIDASASMQDPEYIPPSFGAANALARSLESFEPYSEYAAAAGKVPPAVVVARALGLSDLPSLRQAMYDDLARDGVDPSTATKLGAGKAAVAAAVSLVRLENGQTDQPGAIGMVVAGGGEAPVTPNSGGAGVTEALAALRPAGIADLGQGIDRALYLLRGRAHPAMVLVGDGWSSGGDAGALLAGPVAAAAASHVPVCTVGLGSSPGTVNQALLRAVAARTGGDYRLGTGGQAAATGAVIACQQAAAGLVVSRWTAGPGGGASRPAPWPVAPGTAALTVTAAGGTPSLVDPGGRAVATGYPGARIENDGGLWAVAISRPVAGGWTVELPPPPAGAPIAITVSTSGGPGRSGLDPLVAGGPTPIDAIETGLMLVAAVAALVALLMIAWLVVALIQRSRAARRHRAAVAAASAQPVFGRPHSSPESPAAPGYVTVGPGGELPAAPEELYPDLPSYMQAPGPPIPGPRRTGRTWALFAFVLALDLLVFAAAAAAVQLWSTPLFT